MKKVVALILAVAMLATMGGVALAQSIVEPAEVNIVLPPGHMAKLTKSVEISENITTNVWGIVTADTELNVTLDPPVEEAFDGPGTVVFIEDISVNVYGGVPLYATVTFYYGEQGVSETVIGTQEISVTEGHLDIKPGSYPNSINTKKNGVTPVALLGYDGFDVRTVDVTSLAFGPNNAQPKHDLTDFAVYEEHIQDVNYDGYEDLVSHYKTKQTGIAVGQEFAELDYDGSTVSDSVRVIK
ncbi:hypothetical protein ACFLW4_05515 [Chloroflexota bacterium]